MKGLRRRLWFSDNEDEIRRLAERKRAPAGGIRGPALEWEAETLTGESTSGIVPRFVSLTLRLSLPSAGF
jgi:hypothetical protein